MCITGNCLLGKCCLPWYSSAMERNTHKLFVLISKLREHRLKALCSSKSGKNNDKAWLKVTTNCATKSFFCEFRVTVLYRCKHQELTELPEIAGFYKRQQTWTSYSFPKWYIHAVGWLKYVLNLATALSLKCLRKVTFLVGVRRGD